MDQQFSALDFLQFAIHESRIMASIELSDKEVSFLIALLESDKQTALQLLAADHFYEPSLLPKLHRAKRFLKNVQKLERSLVQNEQQVD